MELLDNKTLGEIEYYLPDKTTASKLAAFFDVFSDATRVRILSALAVTEMCVGDLAEVLSLNQTTLSHQLRLMRNFGVLDTVRQGKVIFYRIADKSVNELLLFGTEFCF